MAPETYFLSISPLFFYPFNSINCVQSNHKHIQILRKFAHKSASNFWLLWTQFVDLNGSKIVGKLIQNIFLGHLFLLCNKAWAHWCNICALRFELGVHIGTYLLTNSVSHTSLIVTIHGSHNYSGANQFHIKL